MQRQKDTGASKLWTAPTPASCQEWGRSCTDEEEEEDTEFRKKDLWNPEWGIQNTDSVPSFIEGVTFLKRTREGEIIFIFDNTKNVLRL